AIAVRKLSRRTAILDLDLHHGNGTQDIFMGSSDILFVSLHQSPLYPGTGLSSEGNCLNFPLPPGTDEGEYLETLGEALDEVRGFGPEVLAVSLGLDTHWRDPLGSIKLKEESYEKMGEMVAALKLSTFIVLEGGYSEVGPGCYNFLRAFA
ncbi:MAG: histone deacetylase, partial [Nitrospinota bacterium]